LEYSNSIAGPGELRKAGVRLKVPGQSIQVLATLLERPGELVTREELRTKLWPDDTVVEFDHSINSAVKRLRQVRSKAFAVAAVVAVVCLGGLGWVLSRGRVARTAQPPLVVPFTSLPGREDHPAFSPDGNQLAYTWAPSDGSKASIYVKLIGDGTVLRLTAPKAEDDSFPAWSHDGRHIAFCRESPEGSAYYVISALGGPERLVARESGGCGGLNWLPDGEHLVAGGPTHGLLKLAIDTGQVSELSSPAKQSLSDLAPAVSPDGTTVAFARWDASLKSELLIMQLSSGRARRLNHGRRPDQWPRLAARRQWRRLRFLPRAERNDFGGCRFRVAVPSPSQPGSRPPRPRWLPSGETGSHTLSTPRLSASGESG
jgi:hypothetical protein